MAGSSAGAQPGASMPSRTREGYHPTSPIGTTLTRQPSATLDNPSSGNGANWVIRRQVDELISSAARGAQNARQPQAYSNASTTATDAGTLKISKAHQASVGCRLSCWPATTS